MADLAAEDIERWKRRMTGPRGEVLALRWSDFDETPTVYTLEDESTRTVGLHVTIARAMALDAAGAPIVSDTKTGIVRRVPLVVPGIVEVMARHRRAQAERRLRRGAKYQDQGFVFTTATGAPVGVTSSPNERFHAICRAAGLPEIPPYHLRHTCASILHDAGIPVKQIQAWLGHDNDAGLHFSASGRAVHTAMALARALA